MQDHKAAMRKAVLQRRDDISPGERAYKSSQICTRLVHVLDDLCDKKSSFYVSVYQAMRSEVKLDDFIGAAYTCDVNLCFPCMTKQASATMVMRAVSAAQYEHGNIPFLDQPMKAFCENDPTLASYPIIQPDMFNLVIVPLVAFDASNNRLGYGGGNYDVFLRKTSPECMIVGAAFCEQEVGEVPTNSYDFPLPDIVVS